MHRHRRPRDPARQPRLQFTHPFARLALGGTVALAVLSAGIYVFGPFSDLSVLQLAVGPYATAGPDNAPAPAVLARTGRSWGAAAEQRQAAAASAPIARIARRDTRGP